MIMPHATDCQFKLSAPSEEGTCMVLRDCTCGQRAIEQAERQRVSDEWFKRMEHCKSLSDWLH